ncbi:MAG: DUF1501 domain-containing protein [Flavobacteriales bacterium]
MKRRNFIKTSAAAGTIPVLLNGFGISSLAMPSIAAAANGDSDRVLILIQLNGGNDGLNTIIPSDQYDTLQALRSNVIVPETSILPLTDFTGMHPSMTELKNMFDSGKLNIIQDVGYPDQNRSHFRSTDIWTTASDADEFLETGWLGRFFEQNNPGYPEGYPTADCPDPFAITVGSLVSETCQGITGNYSLAVNNLQDNDGLLEGTSGNWPTTECYGAELAFLETSIEQTNAYAEVIQTAAASGNNQATYDEENELAQQLKIAARLISGGLQTKVYVVTLGGFDTHANQVEEGETTTGDHAVLLSKLSQAISTFQQDLELLGIEQRVLGMTFSEFGRQIASNDGLGTDHGTAAPLMVFGPCVNPVILGNNPTIPEQVESQEGVPMQFDFRSVYGSILMDWFNLTESDVSGILFGEFAYLPILLGCDTSIDKEEPFTQSIEISAYPNPFTVSTNIVFESKAEKVRLSVFDHRGAEVRVLADRMFSQGEHILIFDSFGLSAGKYYVRIQTSTRQNTCSVIKIK